MKRLIILATLLVTSAIHAETIRLADGKVVEGTIIRSDAAGITVKTRTGVSTYKLSELEKGGNPQIKPQIPMPHLMPLPHPATDSEADKFFRSFIRSFARATVGMKIAGLLWFIGSIWFVIVGFQQSILWGIFILLFNWIAGVVFSAFHWKEAWRPLLLMLLAIVVFIATYEWAFLPFT